MSNAVVGIAPDLIQAERIISELHNAGFVGDDVSILVVQPQDRLNLESKTKGPEGLALGTGGGALLGGAFGWMAGIGSLAIPGVGPLIAAGPLMAALSAAAAGGALGGIFGGLVGLGLPEYEAKVYEDQVVDGRVLIAVHSDDEDRRQVAERIMKKQHALDVNQMATGKSH